MVVKVLKLIGSILLLLLPFILLAQADSTYQGQAGIADVEGADPGLFIMMMMILFAFVGACIVGAFFMALVLILLCVFIIGGTVSMSLFVGFYNRSFTKGFRFFMVLAGALVGGTIGVIVSFLAISLLHLHYSAPNPNLYSLLAGMVGGALIGLASSAALKFTYYFLKDKLIELGI